MGNGKNEMTDFDQFWLAFPRRVGKLAAMKAYARARKLATAADIIAGVDRYIASKPEYADFCHPATWLNQGRWMDEDDRRTGPDRRSVPRDNPDRRSECPHTPPCAMPGRWDCVRRSQLEAFKRQAS